MGFLKRNINYAEQIEWCLPRSTPHILLRLFGPHLTQKYFSFSPIVRLTKARILWLHKQTATELGQKSADAFVIYYLTANPRALGYAITLVATDLHYPSTGALSAVLPALLDTAKRNPNRSIALVSALLERGDIGLALLSLKGRKRIAFVAQNSRAYMGTSVEIATHLNERFDVDILAKQGNSANLQKEIKRAQKDSYLRGSHEGRSLGLIKMSAKVPGKVIAKEFSDLFLPAIADDTRRLFNSYHGDLPFKTVLDCMLTEGLPETVPQVMGNARAIATHLIDQNYSALAISPIRSPCNAQFATIARAVGIPSIAIAPHCLTAAYCRYGSVSSDYAAVYADYFAKEYDRHFGIPHGRCYTFGSPRIMRPINYKPLDSRKDARKKIGLNGGDPPVIAFATQPMPAEHILAVWRMIIRAAKALDMPARVILKRHPEEVPSHVERYRQIIAEEDAGDLCYVAGVDIKDLLIASEVVLTCYSTTAIEAAILERNVAIVSIDGIEYPMQWHEVLGVPFCTDSGTISELISESLHAGPNGKSWVSNFKDANPELFDNSAFNRLAAIVDDVVAIGPQGIRSRDEIPSTLFLTASFREYLV